MNTLSKKALVALVVAVSLLALTACSKKKVQGTASPLPTSALKTAILPTTTALTSDSRSIAYRQGMTQVEEQGVKTGATVMDMLLAEALGKHANVRLVSKQEKNAILGAFTGNRVAAARLVGKKTGADAVLLTQVQRYTERHGSTYAAETPASVAFSLYLIETGSGRVLCSASYDETQQSLTDNLFSFAKVVGRGFRWMTVQDLAREGLQKKLATCEPFQRR